MHILRVQVDDRLVPDVHSLHGVPQRAEVLIEVLVLCVYDTVYNNTNATTTTNNNNNTNDNNTSTSTSTSTTTDNTNST